MKKILIFTVIGFVLALSLNLWGTIGRFNNVAIITKIYIYYNSYIVTVTLASMIILLTYKHKEKVLPYFISSALILGVVNYIIMDLNNKYYYTFDKFDNVVAFILFTPVELFFIFIVYGFELLVLKVIKLVGDYCRRLG
ncbi:hypothetical protein [Clostridium intestinale]|uniref:Uncharacterized protein n=1 Tax=Clostridium intestinale URNW TaxID=1294142 RepID=U2NNY1_9CLOT|nr:hypothetical protein [Clostridium intestinale]ERK30531.1 hypothetical protein CINTURNW_1799 [Clostridium intestinale URNW]